MKAMNICVLAVLGITPSVGWAQSNVQGYWQSGSFPVQAGVPKDVYITGGSSVSGNSNFHLFVNGQYACSTDENPQGYSTTPIRHCVVTVASAGTFTLSASRIDGTFIPPPSTAIGIQP